MRLTDWILVIILVSGALLSAFAWHSDQAWSIGLLLMAVVVVRTSR